MIAKQKIHVTTTQAKKDIIVLSKVLCPCLTTCYPTPRDNHNCKFIPITFLLLKNIFTVSLYIHKQYISIFLNLHKWDPIAYILS